MTKIMKTVKKIEITIALILGLFSKASLADSYHSHHYYTDPYKYCDFKLTVSNTSSEIIRVNEGWIWPFISHREIEPYGSDTKCMIFGHISSLSFEYFDKNAGLFRLIPGCPKEFYAEHSFKIKVKNRKEANTDVPYCELS